MTATNSGAMFGAPPTGRSLHVAQMQVERLRAGRIVEHWRVTGDATMQRQLAGQGRPR